MCKVSFSSRSCIFVLEPSSFLSIFLILDAFDAELILKTLCEIMEGKTVQIPVYDFVSQCRYIEDSTIIVGSIYVPCYWIACLQDGGAL